MQISEHLVDDDQSSVKIRPESETVSRLVELYSDIVSDLLDCANADPKSDPNPDLTEMKEAALLDLEQNLLDHAAQIQIRSKDDVRDMMELWSLASGHSSGDPVSKSDRIVMNIFRHMSDVKFSLG